MHLHDILRTQLAIAQKQFGELNILETGSIRNTDPAYELDDGWSTVCFAEWVKEHGGNFESVDLDIAAAKSVLEQRGFRAAGVRPLCVELEPRIALWHQHSIEFLGGRLFSEGTCTAEHVYHPEMPLHEIHLAYLDSDNDPTLILNEYLLVKQLMPSGAILMVDDVDMRPEADAKKGHAIVPWLEKAKQDYTIIGRHGKGYSTGVLITRIP